MMSTTVSMGSTSTERIYRLEERLKSRYSRTKLLILLLLLPSLVLLLSYGLGVKLVNATLTTGELRREVSSDLLWPWQSKVKVNLIPPDISPLPTQIAKASGMFVIDVSGSMGVLSRLGDPMYQAVDVSRELAGLLLSSGASVGLMTFSDQTTILAEPTLNAETLDEAWLKIRPGGGTEIANALTRGIEQMRLSTLVPAKNGQSNQLLILISDGQDNPERLTDALEKAKNSNISLVGVSIGSGANNDFFQQVFSSKNCDTTSASVSPKDCLNVFIPWQISDRAMAGTLRQLLVERGLVDSFGQNVQLIEPSNWPKFTVLSDSNSVSLLTQFTVSPTGEITFEQPYLLDSKSNFNYIIEAQSWGIQTIARAPAVLTFTNTKGIQTRYSSGDSPNILILPWWLLIFLYLPAGLFLLTWLSNRYPGLRLKEPHSLPELDTALATAYPPVRRFQRNSLQPLTDNSDNDTIPTIIIAIGPRGGELLASVLSHRVQAGSPLESAQFLPLLLDCRDLASEDLPKHFDVSVSPEHWLRMAKQNQLFELVQEITATPENYKGLEGWLNLDGLSQKSLDLSQGCGADRQLAKLALLHDLMDSEGAVKALCDRVNRWINDRQYCQLIYLVASGEDQGGGCVVDVAAQLHRHIGNKAVAVSLMLDGHCQSAFADEANHLALMMELSALQSANGMPFYGLAAKKAGETDWSKSQIPDNKVILPLFDQVLELPHSDNVVDETGAIILELLEKTLQQALESRLADVSATLRQGRSLNGGVMKPRFTHRLSIGQVRLPVYHRQQIWALLALIETIANWFEAEPQTKSADTGYIADMAKRLDLKTKSVWVKLTDEVNGHSSQAEPLDWGLNLVEFFQKNDQEQLKQDLSLLASTCLNGSHKLRMDRQAKRLTTARKGRFDQYLQFLTKAIENLNKAQQAMAVDNVDHQIPSQALSLLLGLLQSQQGQMLQWRKVIKGDHRSSTCLLDVWATRQSQLQQHSEQFCYGDKQFIGQDHYRAYQNSPLPQKVASGLLDNRIWWEAEPESGGLIIKFTASEPIWYTQQDIIHKRFEDAVREWLLVTCTELMTEGCLDHWLGEEQQIAAALRDNQSGGDGEPFFVHGYHNERTMANFDRQASRINRDFYSVHHRYVDRIAMLYFTPQSNDELPYEWENAADKLPFVQPSSAIIRRIFRRASQGAGMGHTLRATALARVMAQRPQLLWHGLKLLTSGTLSMSSAADPSLSHWQVCYQDNSEAQRQCQALTIPGQLSLGAALNQLMFIGTDIFGAKLPLQLTELAGPLDTVVDIAMLTNWLAQPIENEQQVDNDDWMALMQQLAKQHLADVGKEE